MAHRFRGQTGRLNFQSCSTPERHGDKCNCNYTLVEKRKNNTWLVEMRDGTTRTIKFVTSAEFDRHF